MPSALIILGILFAAAAVIGLACGLWLWRSLDWQVLEDDQLHDHIARGPRGWLQRWKPRWPMLTYRRDERGRFRRYRR